MHDLEADVLALAVAVEPEHQRVGAQRLLRHRERKLLSLPKRPILCGAHDAPPPAEHAVPQLREALLARLHAFATSFGKACRDNERAQHLRQKASEARRTQGGVNDIAAAAKARPMAPSRNLANIQGSLRRGEFAQMKRLQAQMSLELNEKMRLRRRGIAGATGAR